MNIILPKNFIRYDKRGLNKVAFVKDGILYMKFDVGFKSLIRDLTYAIYGKDYCKCCGKKVSRNIMTVDHHIPQDYGGPDITNNLVPYCKSCNESKANLMPKQFLEYMEIKGQEEKSKFVKKCNLENEALRYDKAFSHLHDEEECWVKKMPVKKIRGIKKEVKYESEKGNGKTSNKKNKYEKVAAFYSEYGKLKKPIIVDRKKHLLGGYVSIMFAKNNRITEVPVIVLDNVEVFY